jgi:hypothetical protein
VFCLSRGVDALPASPETVAAYLAHEAESGRAASTITRRCAAIRYAHRLADLEPPTNSERVRATLRGIRRAVGAAPARKAPSWPSRPAPWPLPPRRVSRASATAHCCCWASLARFAGPSSWRSTSPTLRKPWTASRSSSAGRRPDQEGQGVTIAIARGVTTCPVKAVKAWLQAADITEGPLFRPVAKGGRLGAQRLNAKTVCEIVKAYADRVGLKPVNFGAHSLRAGFLTSASVFKMRDVSRHKSMDVLQAYVRETPICSEITRGAGLL